MEVALQLFYKSAFLNQDYFLKLLKMYLDEGIDKKN